MKGLRLFFTVVCAAILPAAFVACSDDDPTTPPEPAKEPSVTVTAGTSGETTLSFTITPENAEQCAYICIKHEEGGGIPTAEEILSAAGTQVSAAEATTVEVSDLTPETEYVIVAAAGDGEKAVLSEQITMTTLEKSAIVFQSVKAGIYSGNATLTFTEESETYQLSLDFYYSRDAKWLPAGTYTIGQGSGEGMVDNNPGYTYFWLRKESETPLAVASGTVTVDIDENNVYDITAEFTTDKGDFKAAYKGEIEGFMFSLDVTGSEARRVEINDEMPGEYYLKLNDQDWMYEITLDIFADPASETLPAGTYTVGTDTTPGSIGPKSSIDTYRPISTQARFAAGTIEVSKNENVYTIDFKLTDDAGCAVKGTYNGEIADMVREPKATEIAMESAEAVVYNPTNAGVQNAGVKLMKGDATLALDVYYADGSYMPAGTYTISSGSSAGTIDNSSDTYTYFWYNGTKLALKSGTIEAAIVGEEYDIVAEFTTDAGAFKLTYKGEISGMPLYYNINSSSAKRIEPNNEVPGEYYLKLNDSNWKFELTLDLFADPASTVLPEGTYTVSTDKTPGTIGPASCIDIYSPYSQKRFATGTVTVTKNGEEYTLDMNLADETGYVMKGKYTGKIAGMNRSETPGDATVLTLDTLDSTGSGNNAYLRFYKGGSLTLSLDVYTDGTSYLPAGTYTIGSGSAAGTIDKGYYTAYYDDTDAKHELVEGTMNVEITDGVHTLSIEVMDSDGAKYVGTYTGTIDK